MIDSTVKIIHPNILKKMILFKSRLKDCKIVTLFICIALIFADCNTAFSQTARTNPSPDKYSMSINPGSYKPKLQYFQVRLKGDPGVSLIDLDGNIIARNFTAVKNSYGTVEGTNYTSPVLDDVFSVVRYKKGKDWCDTRGSITIYRNASSPTPIPGLTDLYSANIINPNLFPISRYGERIKFVDKTGKEKFTVMPIGGKEPYSADPFIINGIIMVKVDNDKYGAINTMGKWVIYPEWNNIKVLYDGTILGLKPNGEIHKIILTDGLSRSTRIDTPIYYYDYGRSNGKYLAEVFFDNGEHISNIYNRDNKYITTLYNTDYVRFSLWHPDILLVRKGFHSGSDSYDCLIDISKNNAVVSRCYSYMQELPDGNYLAYNKADRNHGISSWYYVKFDGTETKLPDNTEFPLSHPGFALFYQGTVNNFIVKPTDEKTGYICNSKGVKIGNLEIGDYYHLRWEVEPVKSSYYKINMVDKNKK